MLLDDFRRALESDMGDITAHCDAGTRPSAVLVVIYGHPPKILMTVKSRHLHIHAGEVAFPGGKRDCDDPDLLYTALRESREELGLDIPRTAVVGMLDSVRTLNSNFTIAPFVCIMDDLQDVRPNREVDAVLHIPAEQFLKTLRRDTDPAHGARDGMYSLFHGDYVVWGASARILRQVAMRLDAVARS